MFKLLLTVFLGVCVGAVVADLLFGPDQPATPSSESQGQQWEPWRGWYLAARRQARRILAAVVAWTVGVAQAVDRGARRLARSTVATLQLLPDTLRSMQARRQAMAERNAAHARHVAHLEGAVPRRDLLPPPVAPPLHPPADASRMSGMSAAAGPAGAAGPNGDAAPFGPTAPVRPNGSGQPDLGPDPGLGGQRGQRRPLLGPPMDPPGLAGPPVPPRLRGQGLVETSEIPIDSGLAAAGEVGEIGEAATFEPLGRPPWDALVRRPVPTEAPSPRGAGTRARRRSRRDPLGWVPGAAERPPDPEWDEGFPAPVVVPLRMRLRSAAALLAMTAIFGVVTAAAVLVAVVMAVGALDRF